MKIVDMHAHVDVMPAFNWIDTPEVVTTDVAIPLSA